MHAEAVLATPVSRLRWATGHLAIAVIGTAVVLATFGLTAGLAYGLSTGDAGHELPRMLAATVAYLPAIWVLAGVAVALFGLLPRFTLLTWGVLLSCLVIELAGELQQVSKSVLDVSPFTHVPKVLVSDASVAPLIGLVVVAAVLTVVGLIGFQRRSIG